ESEYNSVVWDTRAGDDSEQATAASGPAASSPSPSTQAPPFPGDAASQDFGVPPDFHDGSFGQGAAAGASFDPSFSTGVSEERAAFQCFAMPLH
ncbi:hypothetical protein EC988_006103, partial [Linderina pennispora]